MDTANDVDFIKLNLGSEMIASENFGTDTKKRTGQYRWLSYINDHLGSPMQVYRTNTGYDYSRNEYLPFGENAFGRYGKKRYRFTGKERDDGSGLCYFGARYYAPCLPVRSPGGAQAGLCRFTSVDPLAMKYPGISPYNYGYNNPIRMIDPTGMEGKEGTSGGKMQEITQVAENVKITNTDASRYNENQQTISDYEGNIKSAEKQISNLKSDEIGAKTAPQ